MSAANSINPTPSGQSEPEQPQIRVTKRGTPFVRPSDIFHSQVGRIQIKRNKSITLPKAAPKVSLDSSHEEAEINRSNSDPKAAHQSSSSKVPQETFSTSPENLTEIESV
ncbi:MAG: hypothetical protein AAF716_14760 [Cyanobacteria bacterium P01_D01_bin.1]